MPYVPVIHPSPLASFPALMAYIADRNLLASPREWCARLREDEAAADAGDLADVAADMGEAKAAFAADMARLNPDSSTFPYNRQMGEYLGLAIRESGEPEHGYYMANCVRNHYLAGEARRQIEALVAEGKTLRIPTARSKATRQPVRFAKFTGAEQIRVMGNEVRANNGKVKITLTSNWSHETALKAVADALASGRYFGEAGETRSQFRVVQ